MILEDGSAVDGELSSSRRTPATCDGQRICILGGGFGGLYTALRLQKLPWRGRKPIITLIDKRDKFTFLPLLYEFAVRNAELDEVAPTFRELLMGTEVSFVQASVSDVDLERREVSLIGTVADDLNGFVISDNQNERRILQYDKLVIAVGAEPASGMEQIPGAAEYAIPFYSIEDSYRVKKAIREVKSRMKEQPIVRVVVVGGSYAGVELSCNLATELGGKGVGNVEVSLASNSEVLSAAAPPNREAGVRRLKESGVRVLTQTRVAEVKGGGVVVLTGPNDETSTSGEEIPSDLLIWTAGSQPSSLLASLDVDKDPRGRVKVDRRLQLVGARGGAATEAADVYGVGDIATVEGLDLPCNAQVALQQSDYVAYNIWADYAGRKPIDFRFVDLGEMMNLGGLDGSITALGNRVKLTGKAAGLARRAVYAVRMPTNTQRFRAAASAAAGTAFSVTNAIIDKGLDIIDRVK